MPMAWLDQALSLISDNGTSGTNGLCVFRHGRPVTDLPGACNNTWKTNQPFPISSTVLGGNGMSRRGCHIFLQLGERQH